MSSGFTSPSHLVGARWPSPVRSARRVSRSSASVARTAADFSWKFSERTATCLPSASVHHQYSGSASRAAAIDWSMSASITAISDGSNTSWRWRNPASARKWASSSGSSSRPHRRSRSSGSPSRSRMTTAPGSCTGRPSQSALNAGSQWIQSSSDPAVTCTREVIARPIVVCRS